MTPEQHPLITRIGEMEDRYQELTRVMGELDMAIEQYKEFKADLDILKDYMGSGQWLKDYEADEAGLVPTDLNREVLSQDALYDFLEDADKILALAKETFK